MWKKAVCIVVLFLCALFAFTQDFYTEETYQWEDNDSIPVLILIPGSTESGIHGIELSLDTNANPNPLEFIITYPDGTNDYIRPGTQYNTDADIFGGYKVQFEETSAGVYTLTISKNPTASGEFTADETWGLTVTGLGASHTLDGSITNFDTALNIISAVPARIIPNGSFWTDRNQAPMYFVIPGSSSTNIHKVLLHLHTSSPPGSFTLKGVTRGSGLSSDENLDLLSVSSIDVDQGGSDYGTHCELFNESTGYYRLELTANPETCYFGACEFQIDETWQFILNGLAAGNKTTLSIETQTKGASPSVIKPDPVRLNRPPLAVISSPANWPSSYAFLIMQERTFTYASDPYDAETADGSLDYDWMLEGSSFDTSQNPAAPVSYPNIPADQPSIALEVTESFALSVPYQSFDQSTTDRLEIEVLQKETALFPPHRGVPGDTDPPVIDGVISTDFADYDAELGDRGWNMAFRTTFQGGTHPDMAFQGISHRSDDFLYATFEVNNDLTYDQLDAVIIGISADTSAQTPADDRIILVYPFSSSPSSGENLAPNEIKVWSAADGWIDDTHAHFPSNLTARIKNTGLPLSDSWNLEIQIPSGTAAGGGDWIDIGADFLFYHNLYRVDNTDPAEPTVAEFRSPRMSPFVTGDIEAYSYNPLWWAEAHHGYSDVTLYNGIYISSNEVTVNPDPAPSTGAADRTLGLPDGSNINDVLNRFRATVRNTTFTDDGSGPVYEDVTNVSVAFNIADWGIPSDRQPDEWLPIPPDSGTNPITGLTALAIDDPSYPARAELDWTLTWGDAADQPHIDFYSVSPHQHQCVLVELDSASDATILTRSVYRNMDFVTASLFSRIATISARGYGAPGTGKDKHTFYLNTTRKEWSTDSDPKGVPYYNRYSMKSAAGSAGQTEAEEDSFLYYSVNGYIATGDTVVIRETECRLVDPVGSFGYVVEHDGEVTGWESELEGEGLEQVGEESYILEIEPETAAQIVTTIRPRTPRGLSASIHAGSAIPLPAPSSNFASDYGAGYCGIIDLGYSLNPRTSLVLMAGYNYFPSAASGVDDMSVLNVSLNGKYAIPLRPKTDICLGAGMELFLVDFDTLEYGYDALLAYDYELSKRLILEIGAIYHSHFDQEVWFMQAHAGLIYKF